LYNQAGIGVYSVINAESTANPQAATADGHGSHIHMGQLRRPGYNCTSPQQSDPLNHPPSRYTVHRPGVEPTKPVNQQASTEQQTRSRLIDRDLARAGWSASRRTLIEEFVLTAQYPGIRRLRPLWRRRQAHRHHRCPAARTDVDVPANKKEN